VCHGLGDERGITIQLGRVNLDGTGMELGPRNLSHRTAPSLASDGRVIFTQWDHLGPENSGHLMFVNQDMQELREGFGKEGSGRWNSTLKAREISPGRFVAVATARNRTINAGALVDIRLGDVETHDGAVSASLNQSEANATIRELTPDVPMDNAPSAATVGRYYDAFPLNAKDRPDLLVSWADGPVESGILADAELAANFGIFLYDSEHQQRRPILDDPEMWEVFARPLRTRTAPNIVGSRGADHRDGRYGRERAGGGRHRLARHPWPEHRAASRRAARRQRRQRSRPGRRRGRRHDRAERAWHAGSARDPRPRSGRPPQCRVGARPARQRHIARGAVTGDHRPERAGARRREGGARGAPLTMGLTRANRCWPAAQPGSRSPRGEVPRRRQLRGATVLALVALAAIGDAGCGDSPPGRTFYQRNIEPILTQKCAGNTSGCHSTNADDPYKFAAGNFDVTSFENLQKRRDVLAPFGAYPYPLLLLKAVPSGALTFYYADKLPDPDKFRSIDVQHSGGPILDVNSDAFFTLQHWLDNGATENGLAPATPPQVGDGACSHGIPPGFVPATYVTPATQASFDAFKASVQPILTQHGCNAGTCHGAPQSDFYITCGEGDDELAFNFSQAWSFVQARRGRHEVAQAVPAAVRSVARRGRWQDGRPEFVRADHVSVELRGRPAVHARGPDHHDNREGERRLLSTRSPHQLGSHRLPSAARAARDFAVRRSR
jgi:hypothetical protein